MEDLQEIFTAIRKEMAVYQPPFKSNNDTDRYYDLWSIKEVEIWGRKRKEVYFAAIIIQKGYVGFYFMPIYAEPTFKASLKPELLKLLKGKSCFHVKKLDEEILSQIRSALAGGFKYYREHGWV